MSDIQVVQVIPHLNLGGAERMVVNLSISLYELGCAVSIITFKSFLKSTPLELILINYGIPIVCLERRNRLDIIGVTSKLDKYISKNQPDVLHTHLATLQFALLPGLRRRVSALVHTPHNIAPKNATIFGHVVRKFAFDRFVQPVAISEEIQKSLVDFYHIAPPPIIHNGIDLTQYDSSPYTAMQWRKREGFLPRDRLIVCVAGFRPQKNHRLLLASFAAVATKNPDTHLLLVGDGELRTEIESEIDRLKLKSRVQLLGWRSDVPQLLAASDIFILASNWEGHSLSVMEAMAAGLPVIATNVGGNPTLIKHHQTGLLIQPNNQAALTSALQTLLDDKSQRIALGRAARIRANAEFSMKTMAHRYLSLYRELLNKKGDE